MTNPRPPGGGAGVRESVSGQLDWTHDTADASPSFAQRVTRAPVPSLVATLDHLDAAGVCACWTAPRRRRCRARRWSR
jgi:hypothetical protein